MKLPTLDEFIDNKIGYVPNSYVKEPGFHTLYVRRNKRVLDNTLYDTIDLASLTAKKPGEGAFTKLVGRLTEKYPQYTIYVENVHNERFRKKLESMGFIKHSYGSLCLIYYLPQRVVGA